MAHTTLPGFRDFYPEQLAERAHVMGAWRTVARRYGFMEYDGPPLEPLELYTAKSGDEIVGQLYNFVDKGGRDVAMRPEMTPTFARMVGARANSLRKPTRWFSMPQLFRYERQQKGRLREHYQLNVDIVGEAGIAADAELIACAIDICRELGLDSDAIVVRFSDRRVMQAYLRALGIADTQWGAVFAVVDKVARQPREVSSERLAAAGLGAAQIDAVLAMPDTSLDTVRAALTLAEDTALVDDVDRLLAYVGALVPGGGSWLRFDLSIVRGLAYYTGTVFELFDRSGEFRAVCGGGRYDQLLGALGGAELPALGFGMGDVVLTELLRARGLLPSHEPLVDYWITSDDDIPIAMVMNEARRLRSDGFSVEYSLRPQSVSKQRKAARSAGARQLLHLTRAPDGEIVAVAPTSTQSRVDG